MFDYEGKGVLEAVPDYEADLRRLKERLYEAEAVAHIVGLPDLLDGVLCVVNEKLEGLYPPPSYRTSEYRTRSHSYPSEARRG